MIKLKPCPFCGNDHVVMSYVPVNQCYAIHCGGCNMVFISPKGMAEDEIVELWMRQQRVWRRRKVLRRK